MTTISPVGGRRASLPAALFDPIGSAFASAARLALASVERWRAHRALMLLEAMPDHVLKDIGWPARQTERKA